MYHVELRQFPHNLCRFNLTAEELRLTLLEPWAREEWLELGERKWNPQEAKLTVLEGPEIAMGQLSMGRGWRTAQRQSEDVTDGLLAAIRQSAGMSSPPRSSSKGKRRGGFAWRGPAAEASSPDDARAPEGGGQPSLGSDSVADSLGLELLSLMGAEPIRPWRAWELARMRYPGSSASECLALAERAIGSLLRSRLVVFAGLDPQVAEGLAADDEPSEVLRLIETWSAGAEPASIWLRRA